MVTITAQGSDIKIDLGNGIIEYHPSGDLTQRTAGDKVELYLNGDQIHSLKNTDFTSPSGTAEQIGDAIANLFSAGVGGGDASAANQLTEIARLDSILAKIEPILSWGARTQLTILDTGAVKIPANANRKGLRISNENGEDTYYTLTDSAPTFEEDVKLAKKETHFFFNGESGTAAIRFITKSGKSTIVTYQEAT